MSRTRGLTITERTARITKIASDVTAIYKLDPEVSLPENRLRRQIAPPRELLDVMVTLAFTTKGHGL